MGKWFCSDSCCEKDPELKEVSKLYEGGIEFKNDHWKVNDATAEEDDESDVEIDL